ncbi:MAG: hypothetical protein OES26_17495, partial [Gammaproteobacteria bacterium]|nr:hypothetical protein [Gammaproteobacteria bacterium]
ALYQVVASTARALIAHGGKAWQHKASRFDYTLGDGLAFLAERSGADAGLIVIGAQSVSSAGRSALSIFSVVTGALTGVYMPMTGGGTFLTAGIVDFRTGDVLWFNFDNKFKAGRDIRDSVIAANAVKELLDAEL